MTFAVWSPYGRRRVYRVTAGDADGAIRQVVDAGLANGGRRAHQRLRALPWHLTPDALRRQAIPVGWEQVVGEVLTAIAGLRQQVVLYPRARQGVARILEAAMETP